MSDFNILSEDETEDAIEDIIYPITIPREIIDLGNNYLVTSNFLTGANTDVQQMLRNVYNTPGGKEKVIDPWFAEFSKQNPELGAKLQTEFERLVDPNTSRTFFNVNPDSTYTSTGVGALNLNPGANMSTSSIQDTDDDTLGIVGNFNSSNGISSGGGSNFLTDLANTASSGITSLPNSGSTSLGSSPSTSTLSDSSSSNFFTDAAKAITNFFSSSSSLPSGVAGPGAELVNSGETVTTGDNRITIYGKKDISEKGFFDGVLEWVQQNPLLAGALLTIPVIANSIGGGGGGNTTNPPENTNNQSGDTNNQSGDTNNQSGDTNNQSGDTKSPNPAEDELINAAKAAGINAATIDALLKYGLPALASYLSYKSAKDAQEQARGVSFSASGPTTATRTTYGGSRYSAAQGGVASLAGGGEISQPFYLGGSTDGMADEIPAHIDNKRPAALSDGEFVVPADVVSHLGNGNSNAGAKRLYEMMDRIREARTGNSKQGIQINPNKFMPR